jgi:hypothetical protein
MTTTEKLNEISALDKSLGRWIADARSGGQSDAEIYAAIKRVADFVDQEKAQ